MTEKKKEETKKEIVAMKKFKHDGKVYNVGDKVSKEVAAKLKKGLV